MRKPPPVQTGDWEKPGGTGHGNSSGIQLLDRSAHLPSPLSPSRVEARVSDGQEVGSRAKPYRSQRYPTISAPRNAVPPLRTHFALSRAPLTNLGSSRQYQSPGRSMNKNHLVPAAFRDRNASRSVRNALASSRSVKYDACLRLQHRQPVFP